METDEVERASPCRPLLHADSNLGGTCLADAAACVCTRTTARRGARRCLPRQCVHSVYASKREMRASVHASAALLAASAR